MRYIMGQACPDNTSDSCIQQYSYLSHHEILSYISAGQRYRPKRVFPPSTRLGHGDHLLPVTVTLGGNIGQATYWSCLYSYGSSNLLIRSCSHGLHYFAYAVWV